MEGALFAGPTFVVSFARIQRHSTARVVPQGIMGTPLLLARSPATLASWPKDHSHRRSHLILRNSARTNRNVEQARVVGRQEQSKVVRSNYYYRDEYGNVRQAQGVASRQGLEDGTEWVEESGAASMLPGPLRSQPGRVGAFVIVLALLAFAAKSMGAGSRKKRQRESSGPVPVLGATGATSSVTASLGANTTSRIAPTAGNLTAAAAVGVGVSGVTAGQPSSPVADIVGTQKFASDLQREMATLYQSQSLCDITFKVRKEVKPDQSGLGYVKEGGSSRTSAEDSTTRFNVDGEDLTLMEADSAGSYKATNAVSALNKGAPGAAAGSKEKVQTISFPIRYSVAKNATDTPVDSGITAPMETLKAHRLVVAAASAPLRKLIINHSESAKSGESVEFLLNDIPSWALKSVLEFAYTSRVRVAGDRVMQLCAVANRLKVDPLYRLCTDWLIDRLEVANCARWLKEADMLSLDEVRGACLEFAPMNYEPVARTPEFLELPIHLVNNVIRNDRLRAPSGEEYVFESVTKWLVEKKSESELLSAADELYPLVRFPLMNGKNLVNVQERVRKGDENVLKTCGMILQPLLLEAAMFQMASNQQKEPITSTSLRRTVRRAGR